MEIFGEFSIVKIIKNLAYQPFTLIWISIMSHVLLKINQNNPKLFKMIQDIKGGWYRF